MFAQDILLLKGEGEVKLNMLMGKGEVALRSYGATGQEVVRSQVQEVEDAWATLLVTAMSCHRYGAQCLTLIVIKLDVLDAVYAIRICNLKKLFCMMTSCSGFNAEMNQTAKFFLNMPL